MYVSLWLMGEEMVKRNQILKTNCDAVSFCGYLSFSFLQMVELSNTQSLAGMFSVDGLFLTIAKPNPFDFIRENFWLSPAGPARPIYTQSCHTTNTSSLNEP